MVQCSVLNEAPNGRVDNTEVPSGHVFYIE